MSRALLPPFNTNHSPVSGESSTTASAGRRGYLNELDSEETRQQGHDNVGRQVDATARDERQHRQQDQACCQHRGHDVELGGVQGVFDPCAVHATGGDDSTEQQAATTRC